MSDEKKAQHDSEYKSLLALYIALLNSLENDSEEEALYELCALRTEFAFNHVLSGLNIDYDNALQLLKSTADNNLTQSDKEVRDRLVAAINNLIDFSVCEEYQLYDETRDRADSIEIDSNSESYDYLIALCSKYNDNYAAVENSDIEYAGAMAALWMKWSPTDYLVYWTQNDIKVRPWHLALQGYAAPRDEFPSWMIPPIEYNCRCFLLPFEEASVYDKIHKVKNAAQKIQKPQQLNNVYNESLAKCGRIFGPSHNYFIIKEADKPMLQRFVARIKEEYYG